MNLILSFVKDYFIFMIILFLFSYLTPKEEYRKYFQFFIGVLMVAILMRPILGLLGEEREDEVRERMEQIIEECERGVESYERLAETAGDASGDVWETKQDGLADSDSDWGSGADYRDSGR